MKTDYCKIAVGKDRPVRLIFKDGHVVNVVDELPEVNWIGMTKPQIEELRRANKWGIVWLLEQD